MAVTMNGYTRIDNLDSRLVLVRGTRLLGGPAATILAEVARRFEAEVEPITTFNGWRSAALNAASGGIRNSNHLSGTAADVNGGKHPRYRHGTFTPAQTAAIRRIVADLGGAVRWGGEWGSDVDEMHFELVGTPANAHAVANHITTPRPVTQPTTPSPVPQIVKEILMSGSTTLRIVCPGKGTTFTDVSTGAFMGIPDPNYDGVLRDIIGVPERPVDQFQYDVIADWCSRIRRQAKEG